ncbi:EEF1A lysine methyltransferase 2-like isoform X3 [Clytia hemisphaerica]|uniref:EEF1A lysine methyltransferase 2-like isoform X3 n=1 Tax=Clytia hemisphaerica TaxID=252671 RepID=UPI0034D50788
MNNDPILEQLPSSQLGTKTYWDDIYENELKNFAENEDDEGENWFGHQRMVKVIKYIMKQKDVLPLDSNILDVGCGNGLFVHHMVEEGYSNVYGIDYSQQAIELADAIALSRDVKTQCHFSQADFLDPSTWKINDVTFDLCHDKGTFDAVCLNPDNAQDKSRLYIKNLKTLLKEGSWFLITSCNWTGDEIKKYFSDGFEFVCDIPAPTFQFGGQSGQTVTSNVFRLCPNSLSSEIQFNSNKDKARIMRHRFLQRNDNNTETNNTSTKTSTQPNGKFIKRNSSRKDIYWSIFYNDFISILFLEL